MLLTDTNSINDFAYLFNKLYDIKVICQIDKEGITIKRLIGNIKWKSKGLIISEVKRI